MITLALAVIGTALLIALVAIAVGVLDHNHDREADTSLDAADWDTHVAQALDLSRQEVAR